MTKISDHVGAVRRYLLGEAQYSPRLENVAKRVLDDWAFHVEQGRQANKARKAARELRDREIRRAVDERVARGMTRTAAREAVAKARAKAGLAVHSFATVRNADKRAAALGRTGTPAPKK